MVTFCLAGISHYAVLVEDVTESTPVVTLDWTSVGLSTAFASSGVALLHGHSYQTHVRAYNGVGLYAEIDSDTTAVDLTPPVAGVVRDGARRSVGDISVIGTLYDISAHWSAFDEPDSAIDHYEWCVGTSPGDDDVVACRNVGLALRATAHVTNPANGVDVEALLAGAFGALAASHAAAEGGISLDGTLSETVLDLVPESTTLLPAYFSTVTAVSEVGLRTTAYSNGVQLDLLPPASGTAIDSSDPTLADVDVSTSSSSLSVAWLGFAEGQTELARFEVVVGSAPGLDDIVSATVVDAALSSTTLYNVPLQNGEIYYTTVTAIDSVGHATSATTDGVLVDWTPPVFDYVLAHDPALPEPPVVRAATDNSTLTFVWRASDAETAVQHYEIRLCKSQFQDGDPAPCAMDWTVVTVTRVDLTAPSMLPGVDYELEVKAVSLAGLSTVSTSPIVVVDDTPPTPGTVQAVSAIEATAALASSGSVQWLQPVTTQSSWDAVAVQWTGFVDDESSISSYSVCVGSAPFTSDLAPCRDVGLAQLAVLDTSAASAYQPSEGASTASVASSGNITVYFVTVKATCGAGLVSSAVSQQVQVDITPPVVDGIADGLSSQQDDAFTAVPHQLCVLVEGAQDAETGIESWEMCIGTAPGDCDVAAFGRVVAHADAELPFHSACASNLALPHGATVFPTVRVTNGAGLSTLVSTNGVKMVLENPVAGAVVDAPVSVDLQVVATGADVDAYNQRQAVAATWTAFGLGGAAPVVSYEVAVCQVAAGGDDDDMPLSFFAEIGVRLNMTFGGQVLEEGVDYQFHVRATDAAGRSTTATSDGFMIDTSPPDMGQVFVLSYGRTSSVLSAAGPHISDLPLDDGDVIRMMDLVASTEEDLAAAGAGLWHAGFSPLHVAWQGFNDAETAITSYRVCVGSSLSTPGDLVPCHTVAAPARYVVLTEEMFNATALADAKARAEAATLALASRPALPEFDPATGLVLNATNTSVPVRADTVAHVTVYGCNAGDVCTPALLSPVRIDCSAPTPRGLPVFLDRAGSVSNHSAHMHEWRAKWAPWKDPESRMAMYKVAVVDVATEEYVLEPTNVDLATEFSTTEITLVQGRDYVTEVIG